MVKVDPKRYPMVPRPVPEPISPLDLCLFATGFYRDGGLAMSDAGLGNVDLSNSGINNEYFQKLGLEAFQDDINFIDYNQSEDEASNSQPNPSSFLAYGLPTTGIDISLDLFDILPGRYSIRRYHPGSKYYAPSIGFAELTQREPTEFGYDKEIMHVNRLQCYSVDRGLLKAKEIWIHRLDLFGVWSIWEVQKDMSMTKITDFKFGTEAFGAALTSFNPQFRGKPFSKVCMSGGGEKTASEPWEDNGFLRWMEITFYTGVPPLRNEGHWQLWYRAACLNPIERAVAFEPGKVENMGLLRRDDFFPVGHPEYEEGSFLEF